MEHKGLYHELVNAQVFADVDEEGRYREKHIFTCKNMFLHVNFTIRDFNFNFKFLVPAKITYARQVSALSTRSRLSSVSSNKELKRTLSTDHDVEDEELKKGPEDIKSATKRLKRDLEREGAKEQDFRKIFMYARPEWKFLFVALTTSLISGCVFPAFSLFFTQIMEVFSTTDMHKLKHDGHFWALMFLVLGAIMGFCLFCNVTFKM